MRRSLSVSLLSLALVGALAACSGEDPAAAQAGGPPGGMQLPVEAVTVKAEPLRAGLSTVGTLRADESVVVRPEVNGRLVKIHFEEGQRVKQGDPLFTLDPAVAQAALSEALANLENARRADARASDLGSKQLLSKSDVDTARAQLGVTQARVESARAQLDKTTIVAPFGGVIGLREVSVGEVVSPGQALVNLVRLDPMEVDFSLPESDLGLVATGQPVTVTVDAFPGETFEGKVSAIEPVIDINSRSAKLRASVVNPDYKLRPGLFARITLGVGDAGTTAILIPEQALLQEGETRFVYVVKDGKAARANVTTGQRLPGRVAVVEGLKEGDQVITAGQGKPMMYEGAGVMVVPEGGAQPPAAAAAGEAPAPAADAPAPDAEAKPAGDGE
ncbi:efflux RND transporter periplasmic adaptor subunit [Arenimonas terrae]|uniref:Efflux RND transporter periplasmic adaptor subunit n=1 Tax=Arenimonas terrae TaxID=2546226 RepID=A0A5C4RNU6_9GAMM|nr:efflux RND transporter periplasmic adaptor subunit [Arenimonas terrae]TNJ32923.1 efflux RND transporter periplasmic adaptor subunit [Arenimonas terrae]